MSDGTFTRAGSVASNRHPLGTRLRMLSGPFKGKTFVVRDRIGWGTELDFWMSSCAPARAYGSKVTRYRVVRPAQVMTPLERTYTETKTEADAA